MGRIRFIDRAQNLIQLEDGTELRTTDARMLQNIKEGMQVVVDFTNDGARNEEIEAAHPAHPQIEQHATSAPSLGRSQERFRGRERLDAEAHRPQQISERPTERFVIVYDGDHRPVPLVHASSPNLVNVEVESIYCQARVSGGTRLPDLGGVGALRVGEFPAAAHIFCSTCRGPRAWHRLRKAA